MSTNAGWLLLQLIVFPGFIFTAAIGLLTSWVDRKVTARVQMRVGPPVLQPFYDIVKYMVKETLVPAGTSKWFFLAAPLIGLAGATLASLIIWRSLLLPGQTFIGDVIVLVYLLTMPAMGSVLGAFASRNPLAALGGSREMKLILAYELPFILAVLVPVIQTHGIRLGELASHAPAFASWSGTLALGVGLLCIQAKLTLVPFDMPEAETELTGGAMIEYSGPALGLFKLTRAMMLFTLPMFLITLFWGGIGSPLTPGRVAGLAGKYLLLVVLVVLIRNTAPRLRIDQAVKFFWGPVSIVAGIAAALAVLGW